MWEREAKGHALIDQVGRAALLSGGWARFKKAVLWQGKWCTIAAGQVFELTLGQCWPCRGDH